jgi:hypothetical protein
VTSNDDGRQNSHSNDRRASSSSFAFKQLEIQGWVAALLENMLMYSLRCEEDGATAKEDEQ